MNERVMPPGMLTVVFLLSLAALPGCFGPFSGAAAMRIEVEVYKGPLSEEPEVQLGSLVGHIKDATNVLEETQKFATAVIASKGFPPPSVVSQSRLYNA